MSSFSCFVQCTYVLRYFTHIDEIILNDIYRCNVPLTLKDQAKFSVFALPLNYLSSYSCHDALKINFKQSELFAGEHCDFPFTLKDKFVFSVLF